MNLSRRAFLRRAGGAAFAPSLIGLAACNELTAPPGEAGVAGSVLLGGHEGGSGDGGYGGLVESEDSPELRIPDGFRCVRISRAGQPSLADSGFVVPQALDGMAAFPLPNENIRLIRNHEIRDVAGTATPFGPNAYDVRAGGGTTSLEVRVNRGGSGMIGEIEVIDEYPTLTGTLANCAGGPSPWSSWLSCEETCATRDEPHGYVFEVSAAATAPVDPVPLKALGRFVHEALAIDPDTGFVYLTEDRPFDGGRGVGSGFYRYLPEPGEGSAAWSDPSRGRLQALAIAGRPRYGTMTGQTPGTALPVEWVDIADRDPSDAAVDSSAVFRQGLDRGAATFQRLEGCWYGDRSIFFNATSGGDAGMGQVWQYRPNGSADAQMGASGGELVLVFESPGADVLQSPDNITVSPRGGLVVCEDGAGIQLLRGVTRQGEIFDFVAQSTPLPEFCGACFGPGAEILFFNIQGSTTSTGNELGATYAMWGPWSRGAL